MAGRMKAVVYDKTQAPYGLRFVNDEIVPKAPCPPTHVTLKMRAAGCNIVDLLPSKVPFFRWACNGKVAGSDLAGVVTEAGSKSGYKVGDLVYGASASPFGDPGVFSEYLSLPAKNVAAMPPSLTFASAAGMPVVALTVVQSFRNNSVAAGQRMLVVGASGGVGTMAVQVAKAMGCHVIAICGTDNISLVKSLGADVVIDYRITDLKTMPVADGDKVDVIFDAITSDMIDTDYEAVLRPRFLKADGRYAAVNSKRGSDFFWANFGWQRRGYNLTIANIDGMAKDLGPGSAFAQFVAQGKVRPVLHGDATLPFTAVGVAQAYQLVTSKRAKGKVVLDVCDGNSTA